MSNSGRYEAFWVPGLDHEIDQDESLTAALEWLEQAERRFGGAGVIVMYAKSMMGNDPLLSRASARWDFASPRSARPRGRGVALAVWPPDANVLEFAESLAFGTALCVVAGLYDLSGWIKKSGATCLVEGFAAVPTAELSSETRKALDHMIAFGGHNGFIGAGEKENTIRVLTQLARSDRPTPDDLEQYLLASGETNATGAKRARRWYEEVLGGKRHRDYRGQII